jgi:hypothetical protein
MIDWYKMSEFFYLSFLIVIIKVVFPRTFNQEVREYCLKQEIPNSQSIYSM